MTRILEGVITEGTGAGYTYMGCSAAAGKTGTSEDTSDAWFAGYTPLYSTAVWVGHPQSRAPTGYGGPTAGPIWASFMSAAANGDCPEFEVPASLPELDGLKSDHTRSSTEVAPEVEPTEEEDEDKKKKDEEKEEGGDEGGETAPAPDPGPEPAPSPTPAPEPPSAGVGGGEGVGGGVSAPPG